MGDDMTKTLLEATVAAMGQVQKVAKEGRNKHDGYNFASIDDFLSLVNPICAANGLIFQMDEAGIEDFTRKGKFGDNAWMRMTWEITVAHSSGETLPPVKRTVEVLRNGAQAYGSAQSYALKQFLRSFLLIPTGDKDDADLQPTDAGQITTTRRDDPRQKPRDNGPNPAEIAVNAINNAETLDALQAIWTGDNFPRAHPDVIVAKDKRKAELTPAIADDEIPY